MTKKGDIKDRVGEIHNALDGYKIKIIEYFNADNCTVQFDDGHLQYNLTYNHVKKRAVKNKNHPYIFEMGYIGVGNIKTKINGKHTPEYRAWRGILERCYSKKYQEKYPTYKGCTVDERWHNFQVFAEWFKDKYRLNYMKGWAVDKDLLIKGNKIYSPETCCLLSQELNKLFTTRKNHRGKYPIGVSKQGNKFVTYISKNEKYSIYLGMFNTPEEAFQAYKIAKEVWIKEVADKWKQYIEPEAYDAMYSYKVEITD